MSVVEPNYWDGIVDEVNPGDEEFGDILNILDFPMESLEGDGMGGDWDASKFQNLGPIPVDTLTGLPPVSLGNFGNGSANRMPSHNTLLGRRSARKELPNYIERHSGECTPQQNLMSSESSAFQTPSPISVLESSGSCSSGKSLSIRSEVVIPVRARSKRARPSTVNPWLLILPVTSAASRSRKTSNTGKNKEKKKRNILSKSLQTTENSFQHAKKELEVTEKKETSLQRSAMTKKCTHCEITKTPQWREGPLGPKTLCNACGVRYRSGRLFPEYRPAASPTFIPTVHSNSHKKVIEMRKKAMQQASVAEEEEIPMSPLPEFVPMSSYLVGYMC